MIDSHPSPEVPLEELLSKEGWRSGEVQIRDALKRTNNPNGQVATRVQELLLRRLREHVREQRIANGGIEMAILNYLLDKDALSDEDLELVIVRLPNTTYERRVLQSPKATPRVFRAFGRLCPEFPYPRAVQLLYAPKALQDGAVVELLTNACPTEPERTHLLISMAHRVPFQHLPRVLEALAKLNPKRFLSAIAHLPSERQTYIPETALEEIAATSPDAQIRSRAILLVGKYGRPEKPTRQPQI